MGQGWVQLDRKIFRALKNRHVDRLVYLTALVNAEITGEHAGSFVGSIRALARLCRLDNRQVSRALRGLSLEGYIIVSHLMSHKVSHKMSRVTPCRYNTSEELVPAIVPLNVPLDVPVLGERRRTEENGGEKKREDLLRDSAASGSTSPSVVKSKTDWDQERLKALAVWPESLRVRVRELEIAKAEENKGGAMRVSRIVRELLRPLARNFRREGLSAAAWHHGFDRALAAGAPNPTYALKAARNWRPREAPDRNGAASPDESTEPETPTARIHRKAREYGLEVPS